jgi:hypothetical protein
MDRIGPACARLGLKRVDLSLCGCSIDARLFPAHARSDYHPRQYPEHQVAEEHSERDLAD